LHDYRISRCGDDRRNKHLNAAGRIVGGNSRRRSCCRSIEPTVVAFGAGLGLSAVSPWSDSGVSASTFSIGTGIYLCIVAVMSSAIGGYLAGRVRTKVTGLHTNEVFFRDIAHGFLAWAFATLISATALTSATAYLANGTLAGLSGLSSQSTQAIDPAQTYIDPAQTYVDKLFRTTTPAADNSAASNAPNLQARAEILRLWKSDFRASFTIAGFTTTSQNDS
jgi:hypothetical protein